jgi:hypothetical protein
MQSRRQSLVSGNSRAPVALLLVAGQLLSGCCSNSDFWSSGKQTAQADVASVHMAIVSVAPWDQYRDALQPSFKLSAEDALQQVLPTTAAYDERALSALGAQLGLALPTTAVSDVLTTHSTTGAATTTTEDKTTTSASGDASSLTFPTPATASLPASAALPAGTSALGTDPMTRYWSAAALYEEVQLINRCLKNAAISEGYTPYVVRLQVTLLPCVRDAPFDAFSTISFFPGDWQPGDEEQPTFTTTSVPAGPPKPSGVRVLPLLVTDDMEVMAESRSADRLRQAALSLSASLAQAGATAGLQSVDELLRSVLGKDFNSVFAVARLSDNSVRCRFGAQFQPNSRYAITPQSHFVTLLVLVPDPPDAGKPQRDLQAGERVAKDSRTVRVVGRTSLVNVTTGVALDAQTQDEAHERLRAILGQHHVDLKALAKMPTRLDLEDAVFTGAARNDFDGFHKAVDALPHEPDTRVTYLEALWIDVLNLRCRSAFMSGTFTVPEHELASLAETKQAPLAFDDGKAATVVTLRGGSTLTPSGLEATLTVKPADGSPEATFVASPAKVMAEGREASFSFPSLRACKLAGDKDPEVRLTVYRLDDKSATALATDLKCRYLGAPSSEKPGFALSARARAIVAEKGKGSLQLTIAGKTEKAEVRFTIQGCDVDSIKDETSPSVCERDGDGWKVKANTMLTLQLSNLSPTVPILVLGTDTSNKATTDPISLQVLVQPEAGSKP